MNYCECVKLRREWWVVAIHSIYNRVVLKVMCLDLKYNAYYIYEAMYILRCMCTNYKLDCDG